MAKEVLVLPGHVPPVQEIDVKLEHLRPIQGDVQGPHPHAGVVTFVVIPSMGPGTAPSLVKAIASSATRRGIGRLSAQREVLVGPRSHAKIVTRSAGAQGWRGVRGTPSRRPEEARREVRRQKARAPRCLP